MSLIPSGLDSPDFTRNQGASAADLFDATVALGATFSTGILYVGGWESLFLDVAMQTGLVSGYQIEVRFLYANSPLAIVTSVFAEVEASGTPTQIYVPCLGPFVEVFLTRLTGVVAHSAFVHLVAGPLAEPSKAAASGTLILNSSGVALPGAGTVTLTPTMVTAGVATLTAIGNALTWYAVLQNLTAAGAGNAPIAYISPYGFRGNTIQFALPPVRTRLLFVNTAAGADVVSATLSVNWQR